MGVNFPGVNFPGVNFPRLKRRSQFSGIQFSGSQFSRFWEAIFQGPIVGSQFSRRQFSGVNCLDTDIHRPGFDECRVNVVASYQPPIHQGLYDIHGPDFDDCRTYVLVPPIHQGLYDILDQSD